MNQIICTSSSKLEQIDNNNSKQNNLKFLFIVLVTITVILSIYYIIFRYNLNKSEKISKTLLNNYSITRTLFYIL